MFRNILQYLTTATTLKACSHFALMSAFAFSKIIEAIARKCKQRMGSVSILRINVNVTMDTMLKFYEIADAIFDVDAKCARTLTTGVEVAEHC